MTLILYRFMLNDNVVLGWLYYNNIITNPILVTSKYCTGLIRQQEAKSMSLTVLFVICATCQFSWFWGDKISTSCKHHIYRSSSLPLLLWLYFLSFTVSWIVLSFLNMITFTQITVCSFERWLLLGTVTSRVHDSTRVDPNPNNFTMHFRNDVHVQTVSKSRMWTPTCKQFPAMNFG